MRSTCGAIEISVCTWQNRSLKRSSSVPHALTSTNLKANMSLGSYIGSSGMFFNYCVFHVQNNCWFDLFFGSFLVIWILRCSIFFQKGSQKSTKVTLPSSRICEGVGESQHERLVEYQSLYERSPPEDWWGWSYLKSWWTTRRRPMCSRQR